MRNPRARLAGYVLGLFVVLAVAPAFVAPAWADDESGEVGEDDQPTQQAKEDSPSTLRVIGGYALSIAGTFVVAAIVIHTLSKTLKYGPARNALVHLLRTNPNQAELVCMTMPHSFYDAIGAALKTGAMAGATQDAAMIAQATVPTYDAIGATVVQHWKGLIGKAKLATVAAVAAIALKPGVLTILLGVVAVGGMLWLLVYKMEIDRSIFRAKVEVLPEVDRAFVDGRYYIPPKE